jgi:hypothetical protein
MAWILQEDEAGGVSTRAEMVTTNTYQLISLGFWKSYPSTASMLPLAVPGTKAANQETAG